MHPWPQTVLFLFPGEVWPKHCYLLMCRSFSLARRKRSTHPKKISTAFYEDLHTHTHISHLMMKSNSDPASMSTPSSVEIAPSTTGANMCSRATAERLFLLPIAVRKPCSRRGGWGGGRGEMSWKSCRSHKSCACGESLAGTRIPAFGFVRDCCAALQD